MDILHVGLHEGVDRGGESTQGKNLQFASIYSQPMIKTLSEVMSPPKYFVAEVSWFWGSAHIPLNNHRNLTGIS